MKYCIFSVRSDNFSVQDTARRSMRSVRDALGCRTRTRGWGRRGERAVRPAAATRRHWARLLLCPRTTHHPQPDAPTTVKVLPAPSTRLAHLGPAHLSTSTTRLHIVTKNKLYYQITQYHFTNTIRQTLTTSCNHMPRGILANAESSSERSQLTNYIMMKPMCGSSTRYFYCMIMTNIQFLLVNFMRQVTKTSHRIYFVSS